ncbi:MAG: hypothetical protein HRU70_05770 [Phycisphaeraceae bacterium]|nr:MAG: hypothetical protein HRU70_05770 [Phycisphaeraceae bacterium]
MLPALDMGTFEPLAGVADLPLGVHLLVAAAFVAGLIMWLAGGRVVRPAFVTLCALAGAAAGAVMIPTVLREPIQGVPPVYAGLGAGVIAGLVAGVMLFRIALGVSAGTVLACAAVLIAMISLSREPGALPGAPRSADEAVVFVRDHSAAAAAEIGPVRGPEAASRLQEFTQRTREQAQAWWDQLPDRSRSFLLAALAGGFVLGLLVGLAAPGTTSELITALAGGGVVLASGGWLLSALSPDLASRVTLSPDLVAAVWLLVAAAGFWVQWQGEPAKPQRPAAA